MRVTRIKITNIMGVESLEFSPGALTVLHGENAAGKTSVLEAVRSILDGGTTGELLRHGADRGEVILVLDDGMEIKRSFSAGTKSGTLQVKHPDLGAIGRPGAYVEKLLRAMNANPLHFVMAAPKDRVTMLLQAMPIRVTKEEIDVAVGGLTVGKVDEESHALLEFQRLHELIYEARTGQNAIVKDKTALVKQLGDALPAGWEGGLADYAGVVESYQEQIRSKRASMAAEESQIRLAYQDKKLADDEARVARLAEINEQIKTLRQEGDNINEARRQARASLDDALQTELQQAHNTFGAAIVDLERKIEQTHVDERAQIAAARTQQILDEAEHTLLEAKTKAERCTLALVGLAGLKERKVNEAALPGIEIKEGEVHYMGVPFNRQNTATKFSIAIQVAVRTSGGLPLICLDGAEAFDKNNFEILEQEVKKAGVQVITARVDMGPLKITTEGT